MTFTPQTKTFLLGLSVSILVLAAATVGAVADRLFVIRPLDVMAGRSRVSSLPSSSPSKTTNDSEKSVADIVEIASESVVTISITKQQSVLNESPESLFGVFSAPDEIQDVKHDVGTGFVVGKDGTIVTNKHVVTDLKGRYQVADANDREYTVTEIYRDPVADLAILKVEAFAGVPLSMGDSDVLRVGEEVIAIGTTLGKYRHTVTTGVISGLDRSIQAIDPQGLSANTIDGIIQTDASINVGNSGGPLLNREGKVIGVNVAISTSADDIGFALPINLVKTAIEAIDQSQKP